MTVESLSEKLTSTIANQFDVMKDKYNLTYEKDFKTFALGYTMGVFGTLKTENKNVK